MVMPPPVGVIGLQEDICGEGMFDAHSLATRRGLFLRPGEHFFGTGSVRLRTILGSCVAVALWNPAGRTGALCHFMLPARPAHKIGSSPGPGLYGDEIIQWLAGQCLKSGIPPAFFDACVIGGGNVIAVPEEVGMASDLAVARLSGTRTIGHRNIEVAHNQLARSGFRVVLERTGGTISRDVSLDLISGKLEVHPVSMRSFAAGVRR